MPTYEYGCTACGQHIEVFQRFSEDPLTTCGVCGGALRKVFHPAGIVFKGSGFYATDSRSSARSSGAEKDGSGSSGSRSETASTSSSPSSEGGSSSRGSSSGDGSSGSSGSSSKAGSKEPSSS